MYEIRKQIQKLSPEQIKQAYQMLNDYEMKRELKRLEAEINPSILHRFLHGELSLVDAIIELITY